ncbi:MAG: hypothetical protein PHQ89_03485 [Bacilli bacterium]|nr:hypothetical protein [Bacilli bacterium]
MKKNYGLMFYVMAVLFLIITCLIAFNTYQTLARSAADYGLSLGDEWVSVLTSIITSSFGFLGFSFLLYGVGLILNKFDNIDEKGVKTNKKR